MSICDTCHFRAYRKDDYPDQPKTLANGRPYGCNQIGCAGWHNWVDCGEAPKGCENYVQEGMYKPEGIWAAFAESLKHIQEKIGEAGK